MPEGVPGKNPSYNYWSNLSWDFWGIADRIREKKNSLENVLEDWDQELLEESLLKFSDEFLNEFLQEFLKDS